MSHPHSQDGSWGGIPASGKLIFVGNNKPTNIMELLWGQEKEFYLYMFDFRKLTSAI